MRKLVMGLVCLVLVSGCASTKAFFGNNEAILELATKAATARLLTENPKLKAPFIKATDEILTTMKDTDIYDLSSVRGYIKTVMDKQKLTLEEKVLTDAAIERVISIIVADLKNKGITNPVAQLVEVKKFVGWVNSVARRAE